MSGYLERGRWRRGWYDMKSTGGEFERPVAAFRSCVDGATIRAAPGRYHLYVSLACPWAHRTLIMRALKGLEDAVPVSVVEPVMSDEGWAFSAALPDGANGFLHLHEAYSRTRGDYIGRVTVPVLWDTRTASIVNNESADIMRMLDADSEYTPEPLRERIDAINAYVYESVNNGVYRCGFASSHQAYERGFDRLFNALDRLNAILATSRYLVGSRITEADWRLFTTLIRFDTVYYGHFKCNRNRLDEFPQLAGYVRDLYQVPGVAATVNFDHIKRHYYLSHTHLNPSGIVPRGPALDFCVPHGRDGLN
jgi:glutathionyl-hydroquinone reductase